MNPRLNVPANDQIRQYINRLQGKLATGDSTPQLKQAAQQSTVQSPATSNSSVPDETGYGQRPNTPRMAPTAQQTAPQAPAMGTGGPGPGPDRPMNPGTPRNAEGHYEWGNNYVPPTNADGSLVTGAASQGWRTGDDGRRYSTFISEQDSEELGHNRYDSRRSYAEQMLGRKTASPGGELNMADGQTDPTAAWQYRGPSLNAPRVSESPATPATEPVNRMGFTFDPNTGASAGSQSSYKNTSAPQQKNTQAPRGAGRIGSMMAGRAQLGGGGNSLSGSSKHTGSPKNTSAPSTSGLQVSKPAY